MDHNQGFLSTVFRPSFEYGTIWQLDTNLKFENQTSPQKYNCNANIVEIYQKYLFKHNLKDDFPLWEVHIKKCKWSDQNLFAGKNLQHISNFKRNFESNDFHNHTQIMIINGQSNLFFFYNSLFLSTMCRCIAILNDIFLL